MKRISRVIGYSLLVITVVIAGILIYIKPFLPNIGQASGLTVERTTERIARGKYLANSVTVCVDCHSTREPGEFNTIMPWLTYTQMDKDDSAAIYTYLSQVKAIDDKVVKFTAASNGKIAI